MNRDVALAGASLGLVLTAVVPLHRVFTTTAWRPAVVAVVVGTIGLAAVLRRLRVPAAGALLISLAGITVTATALHAPFAGPWPTPASLSEVWSVALQGFTEIRLEPAPAQPLEGIRTLLTLGIWAVAHATHELLVRLRRTGAGIAVSGLLWFTPLSVPLPDSPAWPNALPFLLAAGLALLLDPDPDGVGWTREDPRVRVPGAGLALATIAALLGLLAPWLTPGYDQPAVVDVTASTEPRGYQPIVDVGDRLQLPEPRDVLEVRSTRQVYLRLAALGTFDGRTWRLGPPGVDTYRPDPDELYPTNGRLPFEAEIAAPTPVHVEVDVLDLENMYVPVPYQPISVTTPSDTSLFYSREGGFIATGELDDNELQGRTRPGVRAGFSYTVEAAIPTPGHDDLAALGDTSVPEGDPRVALPDGFDDFGTLARQIADEAGATTTIDTVLAIQDHFIGQDSDFTYSTDMPARPPASALRDFLFTSQVGYCEYFATAMAVMLREIGIPARVAVGFLPGEQVESPAVDGGAATYRVSTTDAHAWVEVHFEPYGWIRMDPTPRSGGQPPTAEDFDVLQGRPDVGSVAQTEAPTAQERDPVERPTDLPNIDGPLGDGTTGDSAATPAERTRARVLRAGAVLLVVLLVLLAVYAWPRLRRVAARDHGDPVADVLAAQRRVLATAAHLGVGRRPEETVTEVALRWQRDGLADADDALLFARLGGQAAFGRGPDADDARAMGDLETRLVAGFARAIGARQRLTAPWQDVARRLVGVAERARPTPSERR